MSPIDPTEAVTATTLGALAVKVLGPTASYLGDSLEEFTKRRAENVRNVLLSAQRQLSPDVSDSSSVPPRVLGNVLEEASWAEDEMMAEYLGGVLASSRSEVSRDDRGAATSALIGRLSTYQLRAHYVMYRMAHELMAAAGLGADIYRGQARQELMVYFPWSAFDAAVFEDDEGDGIAIHSSSGLLREDLIESYASGAPALLSEFARLGPDATKFVMPDTGIVFCVTPVGLELFVTAHGSRREPADAFSTPGAFGERRIEIPDGARLVKSLPMSTDQGFA